LRAPRRGCQLPPDRSAAAVRCRARPERLCRPSLDGASRERRAGEGGQLLDREGQPITLCPQSGLRVGFDGAVIIAPFEPSFSCRERRSAARCVACLHLRWRTLYASPNSACPVRHCLCRAGLASAY
jgi:hypothetical protein